MFGWVIFAIRSLKYDGVTLDPHPSGEVALYAIDFPLCGGDTYFANSCRAFNGLFDQLKQGLTGLFALHRFDRSLREFSHNKIYN